MKYRAIATFLLVCLAFQQLAAQNAPELVIKIDTDKKDALYRLDEKIFFSVNAFRNGKPVELKSANCELTGDGGFSYKIVRDIVVDGIHLEGSLSNPGFVLCKVSYKDENGKWITGTGGAGVEPLNIRDSRPEPADFDAFWAEKRRELDRLPMNPKLVPIDDEKCRSEGLQAFDVTVDCTGGKPLRAYLVLPKDAQKGKHPVFINYHGAGTKTGSYLNIARDAALRGAIGLDVNAHGIENGQPKEYYDKLFATELKGYSRQRPQDRERYYFLPMYLRIFRSLEYAKSLPEWDGRTIAVRGNSQGGGQAIVAAASDPKVVACRTTVPALCYPLGYLDANFGGWPNELRGKTPETADPAVVRTLPYFDAALFAKRIPTAECFFAAGMIDQTCSPTSVYVAYNNVPTKKTMFPAPNVAHSVPGKTSNEIEERFWEIVFPKNP